MNHEFQKIFSNRYVLLLLFAILLLNGAEFYQSCVTTGPDGYSLAQLGAKYASADLEREAEGLETRIQAVLSGADFKLEDGSFLTGDVFSERNLVQAALNRIAQVNGYQEYWRELRLQAAFKLSSGLFGEDGGFAAQSIRKSMELYAPLADVSPVAAFSGAVEALTQWRVSDLLILLFCCVAGLQLVTQERAAGYLMLLRPTAAGHGRLFRRKFFAMAETTAFLCFLLYGINAAAAAAALGFGDLSIPIQSVYGMQNCPLHVTVGMYLALFLGCKLLWALAVSSVFFLLCNGFKQTAAVLMFAAGLAGVSFAMGTSSNLWLRTLSLSWLCDSNRLWETALFLNLFGAPVRQTAVFFLLCILVIALSFAGGMALFCRLPAIPGARRRFLPLSPFRGRHTNLFQHEAYKLFVANHGLWILALFLAIQACCYQNFYIQNDTAEYYYRQYSSFLNGPLTAEKDAYLRAAELRFAQLGSEISRYETLLKENPSALALVTADLQRQLLPRAGFILAKSQYEGLQRGADYVYQTGYVRLFGPQGRTENLQNLAKLFFVLILGLFGIFAGERESGMSLLQCAAGGSHAILRCKGILILMFLSAALAIAFLPQYLAVGHGYGLPQLTAAIQSISVGDGLPGSWPIFALFLIDAAVQFMLGLAACGVIACVSLTAGNSIMTILISGAVLLLPVCVILLH